MNKETVDLKEVSGPRVKRYFSTWVFPIFNVTAYVQLLYSFFVSLCTSLCAYAGSARGPWS